MSNKSKEIYLTLNYIEHFLTSLFAVIGCISISVFASLVDIPMGILSYTIGLNVFATIAEIKKYKLILKKGKKAWWNTIASKKYVILHKRINFYFFNNSCIMHNDFLSVDSVLKKYNFIKEEINYPKT